MQDRSSATVFLDTSDDCATSPYGHINGVPGTTLMLVAVLCWITLASIDSVVFAAEAPAHIVNSDQSVSDADAAEQASLNQADASRRQQSRQQQSKQQQSPQRQSNLSVMN